MEAGELGRLMKTVILDTREPEWITSHLVKHGIEVRRETLAVGDLIIGSYLIERKTFSDFMNSKHRGRLYQQLQALKEARAEGAIPVIVMVGPPIFLESSPKVFREVYSFKIACFRSGIHFLDVKNDREFLDVLVLFINWAFRDRPLPPARLVALTKSKKKASKEELKIDMLRTIPTIGYEKAKRLIQLGKSIVGVASLPDQVLIEAVGRKSAGLVKSYLTE